MVTKTSFTILASLLLIGGCGSPGASRPDHHLTVFAASSLTGVFDRMAAKFEAANPGSKVTIVYGGSSSLARQIDDGAPADVFAAASPDTMRLVVAAGQVSGQPTAFATNTLAVVVPAANPAGITQLADIARPRLRIVRCQQQVPCGASTDQMLRSAQLVVRPSSLEPDVRAVLAKVVNNEADAGIVYTTDARSAASQTHSIQVPANVNATTRYEVAPLVRGGVNQLANAWITFLRAPAQQALLRAAGFGVP